MTARNVNRTVFVLVAGGGFQWQALQILGHVGVRYGVEVLTAEDSLPVLRTLLPNYQIHALPRVTDRSHPGAWRALHGTARAFHVAVRLLRSRRPVAVVAVGSSLAVPLLAATRLTRTPGVYVDSITRVTQASRTGRIVSALRLADRFYVQWPEATRLYRSAMYKGTVL